MYEPPLFREDRVEVMHAAMRRHPFATLVTLLKGQLSADHLPLLLCAADAEMGVLRGHIAKGNPLWRSGGEAREVLAIFHGPQTYVTPSWYPSKQAHGKVVPTWNYVVVQAHGRLRFIEDHAWLRQHVSELTDVHEAGRGEPWRLSDAPEDFVSHMLKGIVGIEVTISALSGKWKMSQNRAPEDKAGVVRGLREDGSDMAAAVADLIDAQSA